MIKKTSGQTALVLILLTAAALIFLAVTLNWGRIAQTKALLTIAADQSAAQLASAVASYGEMKKQTYLKDKNDLTESTGLIIAILTFVGAVVLAVITIFFPPIGITAEALFYSTLLAAASVVMAAANLVLQSVVVQPGITSLWNKSESSQPQQQQIYEQGIAGALAASVTDRVNITDYFDWNANGRYGLASGGSALTPNDTVSRFAVFYNERLKMINVASSAPISAVQTFYTQLGKLMNGNGGSNSFQLNDACPADSNSGDPTYSPYCDPCCQPNPPSSASCGSSNCLTNNPYGSSYPNIYDPSFQNYAKQVSFLDQFGRDQQMGPFTSLTPNVLSPSGATSILEFPNGVYPFFWLMKDYSPEVDNIDPTSTGLLPSQDHWCVAGSAMAGGTVPPVTTPTGFSDLAQLSLANSSGYSCQGKDCCVNFLADKVGSIEGIPTPISDGSTNGTINGAIDMVGLPSFGSNPASDPSFGEGSPGPTVWQEGDNQFCETATWPYNGSSAGPPDGTCQLTDSSSDVSATSLPPWPSNTVDGLDDTMHALSGFVDYATTFLGYNVGTLSSTFDSWYSQATDWIGGCQDGSTCSAGICSSDGSSCVGRLWPLVANLNKWGGTTATNGTNGVITNWLNNTYIPSSSAYPWCVPPESTISGTAEDTYITKNTALTTCSDGSTCNGGQCQNGTACSVWGDLPHVNACLYYNSNLISNDGPVYNYQHCKTALSGTCPATMPAACAASTLGRSFLTGAAPSYDGCKGNYAAWVKNSLTLATDEAPKFALRYQFLNDVYTSANTMEKIFSPAATALGTFLDPDPNKSPLSPSAGLTWAFRHQTTASLPNSLIYGWEDALPSDSAGGCWDSTHTSRSGCAHIVKVKAYSPGRGASALLPWIKTTTKKFLFIPISRSYTLTDRDGYVKVSVQRWDEDHNPILFPNGHTLWQFLFHNPNGGSQSTYTGYHALPSGCIKVSLSNGNQIGFGLTPNTITGLENANITSTDQQILGEAFMLNGSIDTTSGTDACLNDGSDGKPGVNTLLANAPESHACAQYIASINASGSSSKTDQDYSLKFVSDSNCPL